MDDKERSKTIDEFSEKVEALAREHNVKIFGTVLDEKNQLLRLVDTVDQYLGALGMAAHSWAKVTGMAIFDQVLENVRRELENDPPIQ